jgi:putative phosphoserine phosphatase/1-acylglycerol-3-phosphate O-acyltransferase
MSTLQQALERIAASEDGPQIAAFFDFDGTLIDGYSAAAYFMDRLRRGEMGRQELLDLLRTARKGDLSEAEFGEVIGKGVLDWVGRSEAQMRTLWQRLFAERVGSLLFPEGWKLVRAHQRKGHTVVIASSATPYQIEPLAAEYGIEHILCTRPRLRNGRLTGGIDGVPPWGLGKARAVREFALRTAVDLERSFGYANGDEDIPFLQAVGLPTAVQAKPRLAALAQERGWPALGFERRNRGPAPAVARTVGAYAAMGLSFLVGLGYYRATGRKRQALDFITAVSSESALAVLGVEVSVTGEEHLWAHRPCVFLINHQSKFDMFLMMYLVRRGFSGVAKKEAAKVPGFGTFMRMADMAFLDRSSTTRAVEALKPAVDLLKRGLSMVMAPEGTRSWTPQVGRFKKGAFHLAMQAGVPVVPVVIRNAGEIMGRNDQTMRAGRVEVAVLPAIDVTRWKKQEIEARIEEVRQRFVDTLEHWPDGARGDGRGVARAREELPA